MPSWFPFETVLPATLARGYEHSIIGVVLSNVHGGVSLDVVHGKVRESGEILTQIPVRRELTRELNRA